MCLLTIDVHGESFFFVGIKNVLMSVKHNFANLASSDVSCDTVLFLYVGFYGTHPPANV